MEAEITRPEKPSLRFEEVSVERSKSFVNALQVRFCLFFRFDSRL